MEMKVTIFMKLSKIPFFIIDHGLYLLLPFFVVLASSDNLVLSKVLSQLLPQLLLPVFLPP